MPLPAELSAADAYRAVRSFLSPPVVARGGGRARTLLRVTTTALADVTAVRSGPDGRVVLRIASLSKEPAEVRIAMERPIRGASSVDLREGWGDTGNTGLDVIRTAAPLEVHADGTATARLAPYEIGTWTVDAA